MQSQDPRRIRIQVNGRSSRPLGVFGTVAVALIGAVALVAGLFLSVFLLAAFAGIAVMAGGWFWWRTRKLRRQFKEAVRAAQQAPLSPQADRASSTSQDGQTAGPVIDGDYIRRKDN